jgi:hypothetical protein
MLTEKTLELLKNRPRTLEYEKISQDTGIGGSWLRMFATNRIKDPGCYRVETLYNYLSDKPLEY